MKKFLIGLMMDAIFDALLKSLTKLALRSDSKVDDKLVKVLEKEQTIIKVDLLRML